jgi:hypothetical protein
LDIPTNNEGLGDVKITIIKLYQFAALMPDASAESKKSFACSMYDIASDLLFR